MKPLPIRMLKSPWVHVFLMPAEDTERHVLELIATLEKKPGVGKGMVRPIPLQDRRVYREATKRTLAALEGAKLCDSKAFVIEREDGERHAVRILEKLTN